MKVLLFANTDWYLYNFRLSLAKRLRDEGHEVVLVSPPGEYGERLKALGFLAELALEFVDHGREPRGPVEKTWAPGFEGRAPSAC